MNYPEVYRIEMSGKTIKDILEDVCDNIFNPDPFFQQGGDMVRVGGLNYTCSPKKDIGNRIENLEISKSGEKLDPTKNYVVGGWGSVNENVEGPEVYNLLEKYITDTKLVKPSNSNNIKVLGM
jgi:sulfur-oxidizing protein SoxB